jgi:hypothetical protein
MLSWSPQIHFRPRTDRSTGDLEEVGNGSDDDADAADATGGDGDGEGSDDLDGAADFDLHVFSCVVKDF